MLVMHVESIESATRSYRGTKLIRNTHPPWITTGAVPYATGARARYRGTSHIRNSAPPRTHSRTMPKALWWS